MPKFKVQVTYAGRGTYLVEAKDEQEAQENYQDNFISYDEDPQHEDWDYSEEIVDIKEVTTKE